MRWAAILILAIAAAAPAQDLPQWVVSLAKLKRQIRTELERQPNFLCTQTVDRYQMPPKGTFQFVDAMRLQVAVVDGQEMMADVFDRKLDVPDPSRFTKSGAFGTGAFSATARNLFLHDNGRVTASSEEKLRDRPALRYDFVIPQNRSGFVISSGDRSAKVEESGSYWVDAETLELMRIDVHAVDIPAALGMREVSTRIDYHRIRLGNVEVMMPQQAETIVLSFDGWQKKNVLKFPECREFATESTIHFDTVK